MKPLKLHPGDTVAIISPSGTIAHRKEEVEQACRSFEAATGLKTVLAPNVFAERYYSAGTVQQRLDDFHWALKNPEVKGIVFSIGGYTAIELVDKLDYELIKQYPKVIAGISDASTLLNAILAKTGLVTFLGLEFMDFAEQDMSYEVASMKQAWFEGKLGAIQPNPNWKDFDDLPTSYKDWQTIRGGTAEGKIIGGNATCFLQLDSTPYMPSVDNAILALEFYKSDKRDIHRVLVELKLRGTLDKLSGLLMGYCIGSDNPEKMGNDRDMKELILEATEGYDLPVMWMGEVGHNVENIMLPIGAKARLDSTSKSFEILEDVAV